jgi:hypothetical protein
MPFGDLNFGLDLASPKTGPSVPTAIYYVDPAGSDSNDGLSQGSAWQTLAKVSATTIPAGAWVLFKGGSTFSGELALVAAKHSGTSGLAITFGSYGTGKATIQASTNAHNGVSGTDLQYLTIQDLILIGTGSTVSTGTGVKLVSDRTDAYKLKGVSLLRLDVSAYGVDGISLYTGTTAYGAHSPSGWDSPLIDGCVVHDNTGNAPSGWGNGITIQGLYGLMTTTPAIVGATVRNCKAYNNTGKAGATTWSGNGILLAQCSGSLIENCEAYNNGANSNYVNAGPVGIWMFECINSIIQKCESHHNKTGLGTPDGDGFDLDGGCQGCIIQYCYSHDNYGQGYQMYQFLDASNILPFTNNTIRYCISENDCQQNVTAKGAFLVGTADNTRDNPGNAIYGNTVFNSTASAQAAYIVANPHRFTTSYVANNIFYLTGASSKFILSTTGTTPALLFIGNCYSAPATSIKWGATTYTTFSTWRTAFPTQETVAGGAVFKAANPTLVGTVPVGNTNGFDPLLLGAYKTQAASVCKNGGQDINALFGINPGTRDLYGNSIPQGLYDIGCYETA